LRDFIGLDIRKRGPVGSIDAIPKSCRATTIPTLVIGIFEHHQAMEIEHGADLEAHSAGTDIDTSANVGAAGRIGAILNADQGM
jgi:hypothetical protein